MALDMKYFEEMEANNLLYKSQPKSELEVQP